MTDAVDRMGDDWLEQAGETQEEAVEEQVEPQAEPEAETEEPEPSEPEEKPEPTETGKSPHMVPYAAMKQEREARQELERRLAALEGGQAKQQPQAPQQAQPQQLPDMPDAYEDPKGFAEWLEMRDAQKDFNTRSQISGAEAERQFGKETVEAAIAWAQEQGRQDPTLGQKVFASPRPVEYVVQEYQRSLTFQTLNGKSLEDYAREYAESQGWIVSQPQADTPVSQKPSAPKAPRSLATVPGTGKKAPANADWGEVKFALDR